MATKKFEIMFVHETKFGHQIKFQRKFDVIAPGIGKVRAGQETYYMFLGSELPDTIEVGKEIELDIDLFDVIESEKEGADGKVYTYKELKIVR